MVAVGVPDGECIFGSGCHKGMDIGWGKVEMDGLWKYLRGQGLYKGLISPGNRGGAGGEAPEIRVL